ARAVQGPGPANTAGLGAGRSEPVQERRRSRGDRCPARRRCRQPFVTHPDNQERSTMRITIDFGKMLSAALLAFATLAPACQGAASSDASVAVGWKVVPRTMYSAYDGTHSFKVPMLALNVFGVK